jgi:iron uptake system EfeUOB component EfeO/EfeM
VEEAMEEDDFEGTLVLEKLAEAGKVDAFFEAIDADDFEKARKLMYKAGVDLETIKLVLKKMADEDNKL